MIDTVDAWNSAVSLGRPTVRQVLEITQHAPQQVLLDTRQFQLVAPNLFINLGPVGDIAPSTNPTAMTFVVGSEYFEEPLAPGVRFQELGSLSCAGIPLVGKNAEEVRSELQARGARKINLITESDGRGNVVEWKIRTGALQFEFLPTSNDGRPSLSRLLALSFYFSLDHEGELAPLLTE
jgi:hypothetical protein